MRLTLIWENEAKKTISVKDNEKKQLHPICFGKMRQKTTSPPKIVQISKNKTISLKEKGKDYFLSFHFGQTFKGFKMSTFIS